MRYLLDTDVLSAVLRPQPNVALARRIGAQRPEDIFTSAITVGELSYGIERMRRPALARQMEVLLDTMPVVSFDEASARTYGTVRAALDRSGRTVSEPDLRIGSIAMTYDLVVVTGNERHFRLIDGLKVENWLRAA